MFKYVLLFLIVNSQHPAPCSPRVVSLVPSVTETIYALGAEDKLVGVVTPCDYPPGIKKPIVGNFLRPNLERILAQKPDIVFVAAGVQKPLWDKLKEAGLKFHIVAPENLEEIYTSIIEIGELVGRKDEADSLVARMKKEFEELRKVGADSICEPKSIRRVLIEISDNPLITCGKGSFLDELIRLAGGINIAGEINNPYPIVNAEFVIKADPDVIIVTHPGSNPAQRLGWEKVTAVKEKRIYTDIDPNIILRPGPRVIEGIKELKKRIYPELINKKK